jgi:hypothetical protein
MLCSLTCCSNVGTVPITVALGKRAMERMGMREIEYHYINMWKQDQQYTNFVRQDYASVQDAVNAFIDGHTRYWRTFFQNKDRLRCQYCFQLMDVITQVSSELAVLLIVRLCPPRSNRNGSIVLDDIVNFGSYPYHLFCVLYKMNSRYHEYYPNDGTHRQEEFNNMKRGAEVIIYHLSL